MREKSTVFWFFDFNAYAPLPIGSTLTFYHGTITKSEITDWCIHFSSWSNGAENQDQNQNFPSKELFLAKETSCLNSFYF